MTGNFTAVVVTLVVTLCCFSHLVSGSTFTSTTVSLVPNEPSAPNAFPTNCNSNLPHELQCVGEIHLEVIAATSSAPTLRKLSLINCTLKSLPVDGFGRFKALQQVQVSCVGLETSLLYDGAFDGLTRLTALYMRASGIRALPPRLFCGSLPSLSSLLLSSNYFTSDDQLGFDRSCNTSCSECTARFLDLSYNQLSVIHRTGFACSLRKLIYLNLAHNRIVEVESSAFDNLVRLKRLTLANNSLEALPGDLFENLVVLNRLDLALNRLRSVSFGGNLSSLSVLNLANNRIADLNDSLKDLRNLDELFLEKNRIASLDSVVFRNLAKLKVLELGVNEIEFVASDTFDPLTSLRRLVLERNRLTSVPNVSTNVNLEVLLLMNNNIEVVEGFVFERLERLEMLELHMNRILQVDLKYFVNLKSLKRLFLFYNNISNIVPLDPSEKAWLRRGFRYPLAKLFYLDISNNDLPHFDFGCLPYEVNTLVLNKNKITAVQSDSFQSAVPVDTVDLSYNMLDTFGVECVPRSTVTLLLMGNRMTSVDEMAFKDLFFLKLVDLTDNRLTTIRLYDETLSPNSPRFFSNDKVTLKLDSNPLRCDCNLKWLKELLERRRHSFTTYRIWETPELWCQRLYDKGVASNVTIVEANRAEDYVCDFKQDGSADMSCPLQCKCYEDGHRTVVIVECSNASLATVPLEVRWPRLATALYLDHNLLTRLDRNAFEGLEFVTVLHLQYNMLQSLVLNVFRNLSNLSELDLSHNLIRNLDYGESFRPLRSLRKLELHHNQIVTYPFWTFGSELPSIEVLGLYDNPWSCDCNFALNFTDWIRTYIDKLTKSDSLYCTMDPDGGGISRNTTIPMLGFNASYCYTHHVTAATHPILNNSQIYALSSSLGVLVVTVLVVLLVFLYRRELQVMVYSKYGIRVFAREEEEGEVEADKIYDVFVSYCSHDEEFVVRDLLPGLEGIEEPYRVCLHHRDFVVGAFITDNILEAVDKSRRTLLVMSQEFVRSGWCRFEFKTAHFQMLKDRCKRVIVVLLGAMPVQMDPEMKLYITTNTYLSWGDRLFWKKLYFALPSKKLPVPVQDD